MASPKHHVLGTLRGISVTTVDQLKLLMYRIALIQKFNVRCEAFEQFEPVGATGVLVLAESHLSMHTYPETGEIYLDCFCCSEAFDPESCIETIEEVTGAKGEWTVLLRR